MSNLIPAKESALRAWLEHLASRIATSGVGVALLDAQITNLEKTCADMRRPTKIKRTDIRNTTGVIGVARVKERTRSGKLFVRYVASWLKHTGERGKASFSVGLYGEKEAFRLAVCARRVALQELKLAG